MRKDGRENHQLREIKIIPDYIKNVPASLLIEQGDTRVVCTATYETKVPHFLKGGNKGWIQAEYSMLPGSTGNQRMNRERQRVNNRSIEIQRFIGRALRTMFKLKKINGMTLYIDTDVVQADGSTRCASINCAVVALVKALRYLVFENLIADLPEIELISAVSIGIKDNQLIADLTYYEDFHADADISIVSSEKGNIVEVEAFAEEKTVPAELFRDAIALGLEKNLEIIEKLRQYTGG